MDMEKKMNEPDPTIEIKNIEKLSNQLINCGNLIKSDTNKLLGLNDSKKSLTDIDYYKLSNDTFRNEYDKAVIESLKVSNHLLNTLSILSRNTISSPLKICISNLEMLLDEFDPVVEVLDNVFEKIDVCMDKILISNKSATSSATLTGSNLERKSLLSPTTDKISQGAPMMGEVTKFVDDKQIQINVIHAQNIVRPQLKFLDKIDNSSAPFIPKIKIKPNAKVSLQDLFLTAEADLSRSSHGLIKDNKSSQPVKEYPHPYENEIQHFDCLSRFLAIEEPIVYCPFEMTPYFYIDDVDPFLDMCSYLNTVTEFAIDLENHSYRSFHGFCCVMQISTRDRDYVIDALSLRSHLHNLNTSFTNPDILKVLHGSEHDILWLQRDFGLYLVNAFDTFIASKLLDLPNHSLAYLLKEYCKITLDKQYQLADWRIRPLPVEMITYARKDTHYLLYLYDLIRNEILSKPNSPQRLLMAVYKKSAELCLKRYTKDIYDKEESWKVTYFKYEKPLNKQQMNIFKALHAWRDHLAREEDESVRYVLPNHMLFQMAEKMPTETSAVLGCCNPVPPLVRQHATDLVLLVTKAQELLEDPLSSPIHQSDIESAHSDAKLDSTIQSAEAHKSDLLTDGQSASLISTEIVAAPTSAVAIPSLSLKSKSKLQSLFEPKRKNASSEQKVALIQSINAAYSMECKLPTLAESAPSVGATESSTAISDVCKNEDNLSIKIHAEKVNAKEYQCNEEEREWIEESRQLEPLISSSVLDDSKSFNSLTAEEKNFSMESDGKMSDMVKSIVPFVYDECEKDNNDNGKHSLPDSKKRLCFDPFSKVTEPECKLVKRKGDAAHKCALGNKTMSFKTGAS